MAGERLRWDRLHPRLQGVLHIGATVPTDQRAARNAYWFLFSPGRIEPAGWGDLSFEDLERVAAHLHKDEAFVPVREHVGLHLTGRVRRGLDFDWWATADELPPVHRFAEATTVVVLHGRLYRVTYATSIDLSGLPGRTLPTLTPTQLVRELAAYR